MKLFKTKNKSENNENPNNNNENNKESSSIKSWINGKIGSLLIFSGVGFALYKLKIIPKIFSFFKKNKGKERVVEDPSSSKSTETTL